MAALSTGLLLAGRYTLERRIGGGGMSEVWSAYDRETKRRVALKLATDTGPASVALLRNEFRVVAGLAHPHIVRALDLHDEPPPFIAFELIEGGDLAAYAGRPPAEFLPLALQVAEALAHAHARGVVHRDLKLSNILVDANGGVHVADFGVAAALSGDGLALRTGGTPAAMGPEQRAGLPADPADDLYAFGLVLHALTTGVVPASDEPATPAPVEPGPGVPVQLTDLIAELLAPRRGDRPAGAEAVAARLRSAIAALVTTVPPVAIGPASADLAFEQVTPVSPRRARAHAPEPVQHRARARARPTAEFRVRYALGAVVFIAVAALLFSVLPRAVPPPAQRAAAPAPRPAAQQAAPLEVPGPAPFELAQLARARDEAQALVDRIVDLQERAAARGAEQWAAEEYAAARAQAEEGDARFKRQDFAGAREAYEAAAAAFESVLGRAGDVLADALAAGWAAYEAGDAATAMEKFRLALDVDSTNADAQKGLRRAERYGDVQAAMARGAASERAGDLDAALAAYREAQRLDPDYARAGEEAQRVQGLLSRASFDAAMSEGFAALERGDAAGARRAFTRAREIDPNSGAARDALAQVETRARTGQIRAHQAEAEAAEAAERWQDAAAIYAQVLELDPTLVFAQQGAARAKEMIAVHERIDAALAAPERLSSDSVYEATRELVAKAASLPGGELARKRAELEQKLAIARQPVPVRLQSDNQTEVIVHQVDRLGRFEVRELSLRPGTYTAVGTRPGYRDVRRTFTLVAGQTTPATVDIRCEERI